MGQIQSIDKKYFKDFQELVVASNNENMTTSEEAIALGFYLEGRKKTQREVEALKTFWHKFLNNPKYPNINLEVLTTTFNYLTENEELKELLTRAEQTIERFHNFDNGSPLFTKKEKLPIQNQILWKLKGE